MGLVQQILPQDPLDVLLLHPYLDLPWSALVRNTRVVAAVHGWGGLLWSLPLASSLGGFFYNIKKGVLLVKSSLE